MHIWYIVLCETTYGFERLVVSCILVILSITAERPSSKDESLALWWHASLDLDLDSQLSDSSARLDFVAVGEAAEVLAEDLHDDC